MYYDENEFNTQSYVGAYLQVAQELMVVRFSSTVFKNGCKNATKWLHSVLRTASVSRQF